MRTRFVLIAGKLFPLSVSGTDTCRGVFVRSPGLSHQNFQLSSSMRTTRVYCWDIPARMLSIILTPYPLPLSLQYLTSGTESPSSLTSPMPRSILPSVPALSQEGLVSAQPKTLTWLGLTFCWQPRTMVSTRYQFQRKVNYSVLFIWINHIYLIHSSNIFGRTGN